MLQQRMFKQPIFYLEKIVILIILVSLFACGGGSDGGNTSSANKDSSTVKATQSRSVIAGQNAIVDLDENLLRDFGAGNLDFSWSFDTLPMGSDASIIALQEGEVHFVADIPGEFIIDLIASVASVASDPSDILYRQRIRIIALGVDANVGPDHEVRTGSDVTLDGTWSFDPVILNGIIEGFDQLQFSWVFTAIPEGSSAQFDNATDVTPTFTADVPGQYIIELTLDDGQQVNTDEVIITAYDFNAVAGFEQIAPVETPVQLDGSGSWNVDGVMNYSWSFMSIPDGSSATLIEPLIATPTFVPDIEGIYIIELSIDDGLRTDSDFVTVEAIPGINQDGFGFAYAGFDQDVKTGATVQLNGEGSLMGPPVVFPEPDFGFDPGFDPGFGSGAASASAFDPGLDPGLPGIMPPNVTFAWMLVEIPDGSLAQLSGASDAMPTFVADKAGIYTISLEVNDGINTFVDEITVTAHDIKAVVMANNVVSSGSSVVLNGSESWSVNGALSYSWVLAVKPAGSVAALSDVTVVDPTFIVDVDGVYEVELVVSDGTAEDSVTVIVHALEFPPEPTIVRAYAGPYQDVKLGSTVTVSGARSFDPVIPINRDGIIPVAADLTFSWSIVSKPANSTAELALPNEMTTTFVADKLGQYVLRLDVDDGWSVSSDELVVTASEIKAVAVAEPFVTDIANPIPLDGSNSWSINGDLTFAWSIIVEPELASATVNDPASAITTLTAVSPGFYVIELTVSDGTQEDRDMLEIFVEPGIIVNQ